MAAGKGTRMGGDTAKVLVEVAGRPMLAWVLDACRAAGCTDIVLVVGYQADRVRGLFRGEPGVSFVDQTEQLGTGHAAMMAEPVLADQPNRDVFVLAGDGPLIRSSTLTALLKTHRRTAAVATLATSVIPDPTGYGRIVRDDAGVFACIVEQKDATDEQLAIQEVNPSYYCFQAGPLFDGLRAINNQNASGEYYITDVPGVLLRDGQTVSVVDAVPPDDVLSINTPAHRDAVEQVLQARLAADPTDPPPTEASA